MTHSSDENQIVILQSEAGNPTSLLNFFRKTYNDLIKFRFAYQNFVINGIRVRYRRSKLGFFWTLLNPLLTMGVISMVFSFVFKQDIREYSIFLFSGLTSFNFLSASINGCTTSIVNAESFYKKIYVPKIFFPLISVSIEAINFGLSVSALYILALIIGAKLTWTIILLPVALILMFVFVLGLGLLLAITYVYFRDISHFVQVVLTALFYLTPIMYPENAIPDKLRSIFAVNPFTYYVLLSRKIILGSSTNYQDWLIPAIISFAAVFFGLMLLRKIEKRIVFRL